MADTPNIPDTCPQCGQHLRFLDAADAPEAEVERIDVWLREGAAACRKTARRLGAAEAAGYVWEVGAKYDVTYEPSRPGLAAVTLAFDGGPQLHGAAGAALVGGSSTPTLYGRSTSRWPTAACAGAGVALWT